MTQTTTLNDAAFRNYIVVIRVSDKEWMAFLQESHYDNEPKEIGRFYWYHKYPASMSQAAVKEQAIRDLFYDLEAIGQ